MVSRSAMDGVAERAISQRQILSTEEATKHALVLPFIQALGYDVFDPTEVVPEYTADYGLKNGEKVDYAVMRDGQPAILFECKKASDSLDVSRASQLGRYFNMTSARIGILTNGIIYQFFSDLDTDNIMDTTPFLEVDVTCMESRDFTALNHFFKGSFDVIKARSAASNMKYIRGMKAYLVEIYSQPDDEFVRLLTRKVFTGPLFQNRLESFTILVKLAFQGFVNDRISNTLQRATDIVNTHEDPSDVQEPDTEDLEETSGPKNIETTVEEIEAYELVKTLVSDTVEPNRVAIRDTQTYCGVLLDDNRLKPICRFRFNHTPKRIGLFTGKRGNLGVLEEDRHAIESVDDITQYAEQLQASVLRLLQA